MDSVLSKAEAVRTRARQALRPPRSRTSRAVRSHRRSLAVIVSGVRAGCWVRDARRWPLAPYIKARVPFRPWNGDVQLQRNLDRGDATRMPLTPAVRAMILGCRLWAALFIRSRTNTDALRAYGLSMVRTADGLDEWRTGPRRGPA